jgi:regulator of replication initiation timing
MSIQYKLIALLVALLAMVSGAWWLQSSSFSKGHAAGVAEVRAEVQAVALQAERDNAAKHEQQIQTLMEAQHAKDKRLQTVVADNDRARLELDRLRVTLAQRDGGGSELPSADSGSVTEHNNPLADLLGQCSRELVELARKADGHAADAVILRDAWPR